MEMSRQRLRTGVLEASTRPCPHCEGTGLMRTASSAGLSALRMLEDEAARGRGSRIVLRAGREAAIYLLNRKRAEIAEVESRYGVAIEVMIEESLEGAKMSVESVGPPPAPRPRFEAAAIPTVDEEDDLLDEEEEAEAEEELEEETEAAGHRRQDEHGGDERGRRRRRRRGRRGGRRRGAPEGEPSIAEGVDASELPDSVDAEAIEPAQEDLVPAEAEAPVAEEEPRKGRRRPRARKQAVSEEVAVEETEAVAEPLVAEALPAEPAAEEPSPPKRRRSRAKKSEQAEPDRQEEVIATPEAANDAQEASDANGSRRPRRKAAVPELETEPESGSAEADDADAQDDGDGPRRGWWQRTFGN
jgi:ribonuclease E